MPETLFYNCLPNREAYAKNMDIEFGLVILFVFSVFLISTDDTLKIASMNASALVSILMIGIYLLTSLTKGKFMIKRHPIQKPLFLLFLWAAVSLLIAKMDTSKAIPAEAYSYKWATGLNSPSWRGVSFLFRLFLSIFTVEFIIANIKTKKQYVWIINLFLLSYFIVCSLGFLQIILFIFIKVEFMKIVMTPGTDLYFRIGGYVGEPQTFGLLLIGGFFLTLSALKYREGIWFSKQILKVGLLFAVINLLFTFSVAAIVAVILALLVSIGKNIIKAKPLIIIIALSIAGIFFYEPFNAAIISKLFGELSTINERTITWLIGYSMINNNLLTGVGIGQSPLLNSIYIPDNIRSGFESILFFDVVRQPPMNSYIEWIAEMGLIGGILLLFLFYKTSTTESKEQDNFSKFIKFGYGTTLIALAIAANSSSGNFYTGLFCLLFALYIRGMTIKNI